MRNILRTLLGALALAAVVTVGATALTSSGAEAKPYGVHVHGGHHAWYPHHGMRHSFKYRYWYLYSHRHYRPWLWHYRDRHYVAPMRTAPVPLTSCLTKKVLPDGNVLFKDICTKEQAMTDKGADKGTGNEADKDTDEETPAPENNDPPPQPAQN